ncbi:hypothetical protein MIMGU_mgv1a018046mg [Erythranthe guttata]|uniref:RING-type E3 ubiquitin transferase n=1 Tax=Erythranthe guttata TaxID=4155 RepID=A0A022QX08_ERYGU|nr:hypothetical protein MIMGU_mgv1a018046mg [Erythranthe guttata]
MTPAVDSSIRKLKAVEYSRRDILEMNNCSICLENFSGGDGGDCNKEAVLSMPCSHIFHGDCIKTWLMTSHYCPLCRFEMPTS